MSGSATPTSRGGAVPDAAVLAAFRLDPEPVRHAASGLINRTWHVTAADGTPLILQRVNPIFPPEINDDIDAVTRHLAARGIATPRVVATTEGRLWLEHGGAVWRVLTAVDGITRDALATPQAAREAGRVLASFHCAVADLDRRFSNARLGVHDTAAHLDALRAALARHPEHPAHAAVEPLAARIFDLARGLGPLPPAPERIVHGDPKISNIVFDQTGERALCLIDLDTLARMPVALELGDAMRSWCNPEHEDSPGAHLSLPLFEAAVRGYADAAGGLLGEPEWGAIPDATLTITVELAARFCADALAESYFQWDPERYSSAGEHNRARTAGQLALAESIRVQQPVMRAVVDAAFAPQLLAR